MKLTPRDDVRPQASVASGVLPLMQRFAVKSLVATSLDRDHPNLSSDDPTCAENLTPYYSLSLLTGSCPSGARASLDKLLWWRQCQQDKEMVSVAEPRLGGSLHDREGRSQLLTYFLGQHGRRKQPKEKKKQNKTWGWKRAPSLSLDSCPLHALYRHSRPGRRFDRYGTVCIVQ